MDSKEDAELNKELLKKEVWLVKELAAMSEELAAVKGLLEDAVRQRECWAMRAADAEQRALETEAGTMREKLRVFFERYSRGVAVAAVLQDMPSDLREWSLGRTGGFHRHRRSSPPQ